MHRMVFDVESVGLHGEGFAVGWVVLDQEGKEASSSLHSCPLATALGHQDDRDWVQENVVPHLGAPDLETPEQVREAFWRAYQALKAAGQVELWTDCGWPVEANFLTACVRDADHGARTWAGPYPLFDLSSLLHAAGRDPIGSYGRRPEEEPAHNPLNDARQSARVLLETEARLARAAVHVGQMRDILNIQGQDGNWNVDGYMHGMYNGLELGLAIMEDREPEYRSAPERWLRDRPAPSASPTPWGATVFEKGGATP